MRQLLRVLGIMTASALATIAIRDQLRRPPDDRTWNGRVAGVPYDFRVPTLARVQQRLWNPNDDRVLVPNVFGMGWTFNLYQVKQRIMGLLG
jgi:hypothetical protein